MPLNGRDYAVIEQALREAINLGADYYKISTYQSVLSKMKEIDQTPQLPEADSPGSRYGMGRADTGL